MKLDKDDSCDKKHKLVPPNFAELTFAQANVLSVTELLCFLMKSNEISSDKKEASHGQECALGSLPNFPELTLDQVKMLNVAGLLCLFMVRGYVPPSQQPIWTSLRKLLWTSLKNDSSADAIESFALQTVELSKKNRDLLEKVATLESNVINLESQVTRLSQEKAGLEENIERLDYECAYCSLNLTVAMHAKAMDLNLVEKEISIEAATDEMYKNKNLNGQKKCSEM